MSCGMREWYCLKTIIATYIIRTDFYNHLVNSPSIIPHWLVPFKEIRGDCHKY